MRCRAVSEILRSVGIDVGTTTTQLVLSEIRVENQASGFAVPDMTIRDRTVRYKSPVYETPLIREELVDGEAIREIVTRAYQAAGMERKDVDTGAIIITGETSRKENARRVLEALSEFAGDFVVATAGPDLESVLAAKGAGAVEYSETSEKYVLHMDIGGGTTNLALIRSGGILRTGCLNVGGRLLKFDGSGKIAYASPVLAGKWDAPVGKTVTERELHPLAKQLTEVLEMAAGIRPATSLLEEYQTAEASRAWIPLEEDVVLSFSGGVADCILEERTWNAFGDLGPLLGRCIRESKLLSGKYRLEQDAIRATVIGAGCHSAQLSGSTVFYRNIAFPLKNLPVAVVEDLSELSQIRRAAESVPVLALAGIKEPTYDRVTALASEIANGWQGPLYLCIEQDMAKALGQALALRLPKDTPILCLDRVKLRQECYLDVGKPLEWALPVVIKSLVMGGNRE